MNCASHQPDCDWEGEEGHQPYSDDGLYHSMMRLRARRLFGH